MHPICLGESTSQDFNTDKKGILPTRNFFKMLSILSNISRDLGNFIRLMGATPIGVKVWASLFPFPQLLMGGYLSVTRSSLSSPAGWYFWGRVLSFLIASKVFARAPMTKMVGPIMHLPFLVIVPASVHWILSNSGDDRDVNMARFITYTTAISVWSLIADALTAYKWFTGGNIGHIKSVPKEKHVTGLILIQPSIVMGIIGYSL